MTGCSNISTDGSCSHESFIYTFLCLEETPRKPSGCSLVQWDLEEWHVISFAGWLFHISPGLICTPDPALPLFLAHQHQAGFRDLLWKVVEVEGGAPPLLLKVQLVQGWYTSWYKGWYQPLWQKEQRLVPTFVSTCVPTLYHPLYQPPWHSMNNWEGELVAGYL